MISGILLVTILLYFITDSNEINQFEIPFFVSIACPNNNNKNIKKIM